MPVDSKVGRRHWGWLVLLVTFWKFQHFNLVSKIFQKLFKPLPCHKSIGKMLHAICISAVVVSLRWASCGPWASCFFFWKKKKMHPKKIIKLDPKQQTLFSLLGQQIRPTRTPKSETVDDGNLNNENPQSQTEPTKQQIKRKSLLCITV